VENPKLHQKTSCATLSKWKNPKNITNHKGCFTLQPLVEQTKDFSNVVGGEQMLVHSAFTLEANALQNIYMAIILVSFGAKSLFGGGKFVYNIYGNPNCPQVDKLFFPNLYKLHSLYILIGFYLVFLREVYPGSFCSDSHSGKCP
jgi:hypothetical protein